MNASVGADERLVVMLEARVTEFEKRMRQAENRGTRTYQGLRRGSRSATRQMEQDMTRAAGSIRNSVASVTGSIGSMGKVLAGGFLGGLAVGGLTEIVSSSRQVVQGIAEIGNEARRAGLSAQAFQEWSYVADQNRIGVDALVDGFKELSLRADEFISTGVGPAAEAFGRLGFRAEDLKRKLKDPSALMLEIMQRLEGLDKAAQIRIADEIFGGTGGERFVELLGQGDDRLRDTIARAHEAGAVLDDEMIAKAEELDRRFRELQTTAGNFFKRVIVDAAGAAVEIADLRAKLDEIFANEDEGRAALGNGLYDALAGNRDLVDQHAVELGQLEGHYQRLAEEAAIAGNALRGAIGQLDSWGYGDIADDMRRLVAEQDELVRAFRDGEISGDDFAIKMDDIQSRARAAFDELEAGDRVQFGGVMSQLERLGGVIAGVISLAGQLKGALASAAGVSAGQQDLKAMRDRQAAERASMDSARAMTEANDKFTASEAARNAATKESLALEREAANVRKRAKDMGATLTDSEVQGLAVASLAGEAARSASGRGGSGGGASGSKGGGDSLKGFDRDVQQIKERTDALNVEAQVLAAAALSGQTYGDVMAYASEKARLLTAAQEEGRQITPELEAQIDALARGYAEAGKSADDAAERLKAVQQAGKAGAEAVAGIFTAALSGADAAKQAVMQLIQQIIQVQIQKSMAGLAESGNGFLAGLGKLLSFDGGGHTGNGPRTGGLDGKGGRLAMVHPRETITDHTKGQQVPGAASAPQGVHVTVGIDPSTGNLTAFVDERAGSQIARAAPSIQRGAVQQTVRGSRQSKSFLGR